MDKGIKMTLDDYQTGIDPVSIGDNIILPAAHSSMGCGIMITCVHKDKRHHIICHKLSKYAIIARIQYWFYVIWYAIKYNANIINEGRIKNT